eukprot:SAG31_NODE_5598_length_2431_cov_2.973413_2_plen_338_part_00
MVLNLGHSNELGRREIVPSGITRGAHNTTAAAQRFFRVFRPVAHRLHWHGDLMIATFLLLSVIPVRLAVAQKTPPTLDELTADYQDAVPLRDTPTVSNFWGNVGLRHDMASLDAMTFTPYNGNLLRSNLTVNGKPVALNQTRWGACEATRRTDPAPGASGARVLAATRLPFEQRAVIQRWTIEPAAEVTDQSSDDGNNSAGVKHVLRLELDGPIFEHCTGCGWGVSLPTNRSLFDFAITNWQGDSVMTVASQKTEAAVATVVWSPGAAPVRVQRGPDSTFVVDTSFSVSSVTPQHTLVMVFAVAATAEDAIAEVTRLKAEEDYEWEQVRNVDYHNAH